MVCTAKYIPTLCPTWYNLEFAQSYDPFLYCASKQANFLHFFLQVTHSFCKEFLQGLLIHLDAEGGLNVIELMRRIFERGTKAKMLSQANHRYALNYINALNYLESLRRHNDYCDFEKVLHIARLFFFGIPSDVY